MIKSSHQTIVKTHLTVALKKYLKIRQRSGDVAQGWSICLVSPKTLVLKVRERIQTTVLIIIFILYILSLETWLSH